MQNREYEEAGREGRKDSFLTRNLVDSGANHPIVQKGRLRPEEAKSCAKAGQSRSGSGKNAQDRRGVLGIKALRVRVTKGSRFLRTPGWWPEGSQSL